MSKADQAKYEALKGKVLTVKKGRFYFFSYLAGRTLPVKKVVAQALLADGVCELSEVGA